MLNLKYDASRSKILDLSNSLVTALDSRYSKCLEVNGFTLVNLLNEQSQESSLMCLFQYSVSICPRNNLPLNQSNDLFPSAPLYQLLHFLWSVSYQDSGSSCSSYFLCHGTHNFEYNPACKVIRREFRKGLKLEVKHR